MRITSWRLWLVVACSAVATSFVVSDYYQTRGEVLVKEDQAAHRRALDLARLIEVVRGHVFIMRDAMTYSWSVYPDGSPSMPDYRELEDFPAHGVFGLVDDNAHNSNLTGEGTLSSLTGRAKREINVALTLQPIIETSVETNPEIVWAYYTSKERFLFIAPWAPIDDAHFSADMYAKNFWLQAVPALNPGGDLVVTDLYLDYYGKGWMITLSAPVSLDGAFAGVVSMDVAQDYLNEALHTTDADVGTSVLVNQYGHVVAGPAGKVGNPLAMIAPLAARAPRAYSTIETMLAVASARRVGSNVVFSYPVLEGNLWIVHEVASGDILRATAIRILPAALATLAAVAFLIAALRLLALNAIVKRAAATDPLTGALNRREFHVLATNALAVARRYDYPLSFIFLDLDHFKHVNDRYGHAVGDEVLKATVAICQSHLRAPDLLARYGGEELLLCLPHTDLTGAAEVAERLRAATEAMDVDGVSVTASFGCAEAITGEPMDVAIARADAALYAAKAAGRNRVETSAPPNIDESL